MWGRVCWQCPCYATGASCNVSCEVWKLRCRIHFWTLHNLPQWCFGSQLFDGEKNRFLMTLNQITSESAALWVDNSTNNSPSICFDYIFALLAEIGCPEIFEARKIAGSNWLQKKTNQPPRTSSFNIFHCFKFEPTEKATAVVSYDPTDRKKHDPQVLTQNISNESQSNTSKWDMGNTWTIVSTASATCEGNSFCFHAHCCAIIVRRRKLKIYLK